MDSERTDYINTENKEDNEHALNLKFAIGYSSNLIGAVHNLTSENKKEIFFPSAHTGVIYNYETSEQKLLQGHCNAISACCVAYDELNNERLIVTVDSGKNAMLVVWNADTGIPKRTIFKIPEDPIVSIDISKDCTFIAILSCQKENDIVKNQMITIWEWRNKAEQIFLGDFTDDEGEVYDLIRFNPNSEEGEIEILLNGKSKIFFWNINPSKPEACRPYFPLKSKGADKKSEGNTMNLVNSKQKAINFTQSTFLYKSSMAITATTAGYVIVWDMCEALCKEDEVKTDRRKIKTVQLLKYKKDLVSDKDIINFLINYEENIVIGSGDGAIRFYDYNFIIVRWFESVCWLVTSISFDMHVPNDTKNKLKEGNSTGNENIIDEENNISEDNKESANTNKFTCKPFITSDISATITRVFNKKEPLINYNDDNIKYMEIYRGVESNITSIALHPKQQIVVLATDSKSRFKKSKDPKQKESIIREKKFEFKPYIQLFYYPDHMHVIKEEARKREEEQIRQKQKENENLSKGTSKYNSNTQVKLEEEKYVNPFKRFFDAVPTVVEYSQDGLFLMVGTEDEKIYVLDPENVSLNLGPALQIKDITEQGVKAPIHEIVFSTDEKHFAVSDTIGRIGLFKNENPYSNKVSDKKEWTLVARHFFKDNPVISFSFCVSEKDKFSRLYAICKDKHLYEFEILTNSNYDNYFLTIKSKVMIEHDYNITSLVSYLPYGSGKDNLIISNDDFKLRSVMLSESSDPLIKLTCLGPCYGNHIQKLRIIPGTDKDKRLLAFNTGKKVFGLIYLPIDGNPFRYMGVIGHPREIQDIKPAKNLNYILTTGGSDYTINGWKYNIDPLNDAVLNNGSDLKPFLTLLDGGEDGLKYQEMKNFFYYAQIKSKEENTTKHRTLSETVPNNLIHGLLAAMDYYPSQKEIVNIVNEISKGDVKSDGVTFDMFVKIYLNHKPYKELEMTKMDTSFDTVRNFISESKHKDLEKYNDTKFTSEKGIGRDTFFRLLLEQGEVMSESELQDILRVLRGDSNFKSMPDTINFQYLFEELMKFEVFDKNDEK